MVGIAVAAGALEWAVHTGNVAATVMPSFALTFQDELAVSLPLIFTRHMVENDNWSCLDAFLFLIGLAFDWWKTALGLGASWYVDRLMDADVSSGFIELIV